MANDNRVYTFLISPSRTSKVRQLSIHFNLLRSAVGCVIISILLVFYGSVSDILRLASIPRGLPVNGYVTDGFGMRRNPFNGEGREVHEGLDIAVDFGTPVTATADGLVIYAAPHAGYGNLVIVYHSNGITTRYGHLSRISVEAGQRVKRSDQIGNAGSTGRSTGPHVHYEIRENDQPVDPLRYAGQSQP